MTHDKRAHSATLCAVIEPVAQPVWDEGENLAAVLLGAEENLVALEAVHVEQADIGYPKAGVHHHPNEVFQIVARIDLSLFKSVRPLDGSELLAGIKDA